MAEFISGIYSITNIVNGKIYIGSAVDIGNRWSCHRGELRKDTHNGRPASRPDHLQAAWNKYGEEAFEFKVLFYWPKEPKQALLDMETAAIAAYKSADPEFGYNICSVAGSCFGVKHTADTRRKISESKKGNHNRKGKKHSESTKRKISATKKGTLCSESHRNNISSGLVGKKHTVTTICIMIASAKNRTEEQNHRAALAKIGHPVSEETKRKISLSNSGVITKLTEKQVLEIRYFYSTGQYSQRSLAVLYGVSNNTIHKIVAHKTWASID